MTTRRKNLEPTTPLAHVSGKQRKYFGTDEEVVIPLVRRNDDDGRWWDCWAKAVLCQSSCEEVSCPLLADNKSLDSHVVYYGLTRRLLSRLAVVPVIIIIIIIT
jgi:hypothetical protein